MIIYCHYTDDVGFTHSATLDFLFCPSSYDYHTTNLEGPAPSKGLMTDASLWDFPRVPAPVTVKPCKDCSRCSPLARQAGGSCSCVCVLRECSHATASSMQPFQFPSGRLRE